MHQTGRKQAALLVARRVIYKILGLLSAASGFSLEEGAPAAPAWPLKIPDGFSSQVSWLCRLRELLGSLSSLLRGGDGFRAPVFVLEQSFQKAQADSCHRFKKPFSLKNAAEIVLNNLLSDVSPVAEAARGALVVPAVPCGPALRARSSRGRQRRLGLLCFCCLPKTRRAQQGAFPHFIFSLLTGGLQG